MHLPMQITYPEEHKRKRVTNVTTDVNNSLYTLANNYNIAIVDSNGFYKPVLENSIGNKLIIGITTLDRLISSNNPRSAFLSDGIHPGTVLNG